VSASQPSLVSAVAVAGEKALPAGCARWASLPYPILICGERGTGKTELAAHLHKASGRQGPFVTGSLAQVPKGMEVPELLGHSRGAFTRSVRAHRVLEACGGNKTEVARRLRTSRQHLHRVLRGVPLAPPVNERESQAREV
jgi:DNA-binding NtrC family response regulator